MYQAQNENDFQSILESSFTFLLVGADAGLRIPLIWKDSDHFNDKGSEFVLVLITIILMFIVIDAYSTNRCCTSLIFTRFSSSCGFLSDADGLTGVWHRDGGGG